MDEIVAFMQKYRALGYAVVVFTPEELRGVNPERVEDAMIVEGNDLVDLSGGEEEEEESA